MEARCLLHFHLRCCEFHACFYNPWDCLFGHKICLTGGSFELLRRIVAHPPFRLVLHLIVCELLGYPLSEDSWDCYSAAPSFSLVVDLPLLGEAIAAAPELSPGVLQFFEGEREIGDQVVGGDDLTSLKVGEEEEEERELSAAPTEASEEARLSAALKKSRKRTVSSTFRSRQQGSEFELEEEQGEGSENNYTSTCASLPVKLMNSASHLLEEF